MKPFSELALTSVVGDKKSGLGFGCMGITAFYGDSMPDDKALELLQQVYDAGCRHYDTAEVYATKEKYNESILGTFFQTVPRDSFSVATKFWPQGETGNYDYETVKKSLTASLKRLQLDYVDLYYAHRVYSLEGGKEFARTALRLKEEGLIKGIGLSEVSGKWLKEIYTEVGPVDAVQQEWSLMTRNLEEELVPVCKELDVDIVAYSPLSRNLLAAKVEAPPEDWRGTLPRYSKENLEKNIKIHDTVQGIAAKYEGANAAQLSLAWLFHKATELGVTVIPIPGSTKIKNAVGNCGSTKIEISDEDCKSLESVADMVAGLRGPEWYTDRGIESQS